MVTRLLANQDLTPMLSQSRFDANALQMRLENRTHHSKMAIKYTTVPRHAGEGGRGEQASLLPFIWGAGEAKVSFLKSFFRH